MLQQLENIYKLCINLILLIGKFCFLFLITYLGQNIENHSNEVFEKWYVFSLLLYNIYIIYIMLIYS